MLKHCNEDINFTFNDELIDKQLKLNCHKFENHIFLNKVMRYNDILRHVFFRLIFLSTSLSFLFGY